MITSVTLKTGTRVLTSYVQFERSSSLIFLVIKADGTTDYMEYKFPKEPKP